MLISIRNVENYCIFIGLIIFLIKSQKGRNCKNINIFKIILKIKVKCNMSMYSLYWILKKGNNNIYLKSQRLA